MTTTLAPPATPATVKGTQLRVTHARVLLSEWTKFRSLRSTVATLLVAEVLMIGLGAMFAAITANAPAGFGPGTTAVSTSLTGTFFAQLAVGVLGVLLITGEYSTGMIRSSLTVVPSRLPMLWGKLAVFGITVFLTMLAASFTSFFVGQALLGDQLNASLSDPGALRSWKAPPPGGASPGPVELARTPRPIPSAPTIAPRSGPVPRRTERLAGHRSGLNYRFSTVTWRAEDDSRTHPEIDH